MAGRLPEIIKELENEFRTKLIKIRELKEGWYDGDGFVPTKEQLDYFEENFIKNELSTVEKPFLVPTLEGGIIVEYTTKKHCLSLDFNLKDNTCYLHDLNYPEDTDNEMNFTLDDLGWKKLGDIVWAIFDE